MTWRDDAACRGASELFAMPHSRNLASGQVRAFIARAKAICNTCPAKDDCLTEYLAEPDSWVIAGGPTPAERRRLAKGRVAS
jgi:hypothetical protein